MKMQTTPDLRRSTSPISTAPPGPSHELRLNFRGKHYQERGTV
jgi:hypothetical protein